MKYFLSVYVILFLGCMGLYANHTAKDNTISLKYSLNTSELFNSHTVRCPVDEIFKTSQTSLEKNEREIRGTDNEVAEEEESISAKRGLITSTYFSSVLYAEQLGCLCGNVKKRLLKSKFFVHFSTNRLQIIYNVFII